MYINTETNEYPLSENDIRKQYPNTSFPTPFIPPEQYKYVFPNPKPHYNDILEEAIESIPQINDRGLYQQVWKIVSLDQETINKRKKRQEDDVRNTRNFLLKESDWTQVGDAPVNKEIWAQYRQLLREITNQSGFPYNITWPTPPEIN